MKKIFLAFLSVFCILSFVACGKNSSNGIDKNLPSENGEVESGQTTTSKYAVGDIILADGMAIKADHLIELDNDNLPIAVIALLQENNAIGIGVHRSEQCLRYEAQSENEKTASEFASEYALTYQISGEYALGWRLPEVEELKIVYENRNTINTSLQKIYRLDNNAAMNGLGNAWYWTGTPATTKKDCTWFVHFVNGYAGECERDMTNLNVVAVRSFNNR